MGNSKSTIDTEQTDCKIWDGAVCAVGIALKNRRHAESDLSPAIASVNFDHVTFSREPVIPIDTEIAIGLLELFYLALHRAVDPRLERPIANKEANISLTVVSVRIEVLFEAIR